MSQCSASEEQVPTSTLYIDESPKEQTSSLQLDNSNNKNVNKSRNERNLFTYNFISVDEEIQNSELKNFYSSSNFWNSETYPKNEQIKQVNGSSTVLNNESNLNQIDINSNFCNFKNNQLSFTNNQYYAQAIPVSNYWQSNLSTYRNQGNTPQYSNTYHPNNSYFKNSNSDHFNKKEPFYPNENVSNFPPIENITQYSDNNIDPISSLNFNLNQESFNDTGSIHKQDKRNADSPNLIKEYLKDNSKVSKTTENKKTNDDNCSKSEIIEKNLTNEQIDVFANQNLQDYTKNEKLLEPNSNQQLWNNIEPQALSQTYDSNIKESEFKPNNYLKVLHRFSSPITPKTRPKHFDIIELTIGKFKLDSTLQVEHHLKNINSENKINIPYAAKMKVVFNKQRFIYEFSLKNSLSNYGSRRNQELETQFFVVIVPFCFLEAIKIEKAYVRFIVNKQPLLFLGQGSNLGEFNFCDEMDPTNGEIKHNALHVIKLPASQTDRLKSCLINFTNTIASSKTDNLDSNSVNFYTLLTKPIIENQDYSKNLPKVNITDEQLVNTSFNDINACPIKHFETMEKDKINTESHKLKRKSDKIDEPLQNNSKKKTNYQICLPETRVVINTNETNGLDLYDKTKISALYLPINQQNINHNLYQSGVKLSNQAIPTFKIVRSQDLGTIQNSPVYGQKNYIENEIKTKKGICDCKGSCNQRTCECFLYKKSCSQPFKESCKCFSCENPFNLLENFRINIEYAMKDACFMQKFYNILYQNLEYTLHNQVNLPCCGKVVMIAFLLTGVIYCPNMNCKRPLRFSWCLNQVIDLSKNSIRHCEVCNRCEHSINNCCLRCSKIFD